MPFKANEVTSLPAPMFHALGFLHATIAMMLGTTLVLRRRFKPATVLADIEKNKVTAMVVVPVMLSRILDELEKTQPKPDLSSLRIVFVSGSQLGAELATRALKDLGPVIYNLYGSTEIAFATIARPKDLSINPATVGPVVKGVKVKILDDNGNELPQGEVGRIFVGNTFPFEGYTGGGHKQIIDGLMSSGDVGYFDEHNLLYVSGRDDEMIVSGGENVFPAEVEDLISGHPEVIEATALGVEDKEWGHRLRAFVVKAEGASVDEDAIKNYVRENLARYKVPREVIFLDELPRNPTGKILKQRTPRNRSGIVASVGPQGANIAADHGYGQADQHEGQQEPPRALPDRPRAAVAPDEVCLHERADAPDEQDRGHAGCQDDRSLVDDAVDGERDACDHYDRYAVGDRLAQGRGIVPPLLDVAGVTHYQGPLTYQDRHPGWSRHAMIAPASGAAPRILGPRGGRLQFTTNGFHGITPLTHGCATCSVSD